jgi:hypothetical protein
MATLSSGRREGQGEILGLTGKSRVNLEAMQGAEAGPCC